MPIPSRSLVPLFILLLAACQSGGRDPHTEDDQTFGDITIIADEDLANVLDSQRKVFEHFYATARVRIRPLSGQEVLSAMMNDSIRIAFTTCLPGAAQQDYLRSRNVTAPEVPILTDGIAIVCGPASAMERMSVPRLRAELRAPGPLRLLVAGEGSGVARTVVDSILDGDVSQLKNLAATRNLEELVERLATDTHAVGLIAFAHISDLDDQRCVAIRGRVRLIPMAATDTGRAVLPSQSTLADGSYPLRRKLYAVLTEGKAGLGTGFVSFVAGHKGQRIILKSGLAPHKVPTREVMIVNP